MTASYLRLPLSLACAGILLVGLGCGSDDSDKEAPAARPCQTPPPSAPSGSDAGTDAEAARNATIAYFVTCDPAACKDDVTERHIRVDYRGSVARCEKVRRNNKLTRGDFTIAGDPKVEGDKATVDGQVLLTGETFAVVLKKVDGAWKIDRIRGSQ